MDVVKKYDQWFRKDPGAPLSCAGIWWWGDQFCSSSSFFFMWTIFSLYGICYSIVSVFCFPFSFSLWDLSSLTRDGSYTPYSGRQRFNHWITREVLQFLSFNRALRPLAFKGIIVEGISTRIMIGLLLTLILCSYFCLPLFYKPFIVLMEHLIWFHFLLVPYISVIFPFFIF